MTEFKQDDDETPVIFRRWRGGPTGIIAIFPTDAGDMNVESCSSFEHIGQHAACHPRHVIANSSPAAETEYAELKTELESAPYGYRLKVYKRYQSRWRDVRETQLMAIGRQR